ncbi:BLUF domain-containing protein [Ramlibacter sp. AN1015]|uniref:BLUF domain-containing protein n=1 Tax=Ramlibacter sp. AN1015 TaxID=3133428 RepID=UPI0030C2D41D
MRAQDSAAADAAAADKNDLWSIGYVSTAMNALQPEALQALLAHSRRANDAVAVTGVLLHCGGNFMQVIEGPPEAVRTTYGRICRNPAHHTIIELFNEPVAQRDFGGWAMACREISSMHLEQLRCGTLSVRRQMLAEFWAGNR